MTRERISNEELLVPKISGLQKKSKQNPEEILHFISITGKTIRKKSLRKIYINAEFKMTYLIT